MNGLKSNLKVPETIIAQFYYWNQVIFKRCPEKDETDKFCYVPDTPDWESEFWQHCRSEYENASNGEYKDYIDLGFTFEEYVEDTIMEHFYWDSCNLYVLAEEFRNYDPKNSWFLITI